MKGLSPEPLVRTELFEGSTIPCDRLYAIENGPSGFNPTSPAYLPKSRFLMLMRNARLAELRTNFDEATHTLTITAERREKARANLRTVEGRAEIERFSQNFAGPNCVTRRKFSTRPAIASRTSRAKSFPSSIWLRSPLSKMQRRAGTSAALSRQSLCRGLAGLARVRSARPRDRDRPRARLKIVKRIVRCAATEVDPDTGIRDLPIPQILLQTFGHMDCGIYGEVVAGGSIAVGDNVTPINS